jgi:hypothetical protein
VARAERMLPKVAAPRRAGHEASVTAHPVLRGRMACVQWPAMVAIVGSESIHGADGYGRGCEAFLNLGRGPELFESAWPTSVRNTVPSRVRHVLAQRSIGHQRSNRACEIFDVMRPGDQTIRLVRH